MRKLGFKVTSRSVNIIGIGGSGRCVQPNPCWYWGFYTYTPTKTRSPPPRRVLSILYSLPDLASQPIRSFRSHHIRYNSRLGVRGQSEIECQAIFLLTLDRAKDEQRGKYSHKEFLHSWSQCIQCSAGRYFENLSRNQDLL